MFADGTCTYNGMACAPDDPRLLALTAHVAPVEVRPAAPAPQPPIASPLAPKPSSDRPARFAPTGAGDRRGRRGARPRRRWCHATQPNRIRAAKHGHAVTPICGSGLTDGTLLRPNNRRPVHANGPVEAASLPCNSPARRRIERWHSGQAACLRAPAAHRHLFPRSLFAGPSRFTTPSGLGRPRKPWPICRCAWRCACTAAAKSGGGPVGCKTLHGYSRGTRGTL